MEEKEAHKEFSQTYVKNIFRILLISSIIISISIVITAFLGYNNTKKALIEKSKSQDIVFMVKSMASKIDGRISRAVETSYIFARDPINIEWMAGEEKDEKLGNFVLNNLGNIATSYDYNYFFLAGVNTKKYYFREASNKKIDDKNYVLLSENNPEDSWFFDMLKSKKEMSFNVNYDRAMDDSFLFVNTIMGNVDNPVGITGVALNLNSITKEFKESKIGKTSNLWLVDEKGVIKLSDTREDIGKNLSDFLPVDILTKVQTEAADKSNTIEVSEYHNTNNDIMDYAYTKLASTDWILFYKIPRKENLSLLDSLLSNTIVTVILVITFFIVLFYFISKKVANPYKQALLINQELENKVNIRTSELKESNQKIKDSIEYAKRLQESILPLDIDMKRLFKDSFVIWKPKDIVGGDFFWLKEIDDVTILAVGDCTGHGVPGAFMTMTVNAILHNIVTTINKDDPSSILRELHIKLKQTLNKTTNTEGMDDGLDIAIFCIKQNTSLLYAGANIDLYVKNNSQVKIYKPQTKGVGYSYIELNEALSNEVIPVEENDIFLVTTDGFLHQNGGQKNYPFGKKRFHTMIEDCEEVNLNLMKTKFEISLKEYMNTEDQRDDITVFAFKVSKVSEDNNY